MAHPVAHPSHHRGEQQPLLRLYAFSQLHNFQHMNFCRLFLKHTLFSLIFFLPAYASSRVDSYYQADISVASQTETDRDQAMERGLQAVLLKISGPQSSPPPPAVKHVLPHAIHYINAYHYTHDPAFSSPYILNMQFDRYSIDHLLQKAKLQPWPMRHRPIILIWLLVQTSSDPTPHVMTQDTEEHYAVNLLKQHAQKYALPILFPMLDLTDMQHINPNDFTDLQITKFQLASKRYRPDGLLIGFIRSDDYTSSLQSQWTLAVQKNIWHWSLSAATMPELFQRLLPKIVNTLIEEKNILPVHKPLSPPMTQWFTLRIDNITQRSDLEKVIHELKTLELIREVKLEKISNDTAELRVSAVGAEDDLHQNIILNEHFVDSSSPVEMDQQRLLQYTWIHD